MKKLMIGLAAAAAAVGAWAETEYANGYTWTYRINGGTAEIYNGGYGSAAVSPSPTGAVTIPSKLGGKPVTSIGSYAFARCSGLTSVTIPNSVTSIGDDASPWARTARRCISPEPKASREAVATGVRLAASS